MTRSNRIQLTAIVLIAASACEPGDVAGDRAGNPPEPIVITIATEEIHPTPTLLLELLSDRVNDLSDGAVQLEVRSRAIDGGLAWDQETIELAVQGDVDGVLVRAGSWHDFGVTSLDLLQLPGVVDTDDQADRLAVDSDLVSRLLDGLQPIGFTGLGLYPEGPRYLMLLDGTTGFSLDALADRKVRTPLSATVFDVLASLGMRPVDVSPQEFVGAVESGEVTATEGHLERVTLTVTSDGGNDSVVATNLALYTKFVVLAVRTDAVSPEVFDLFQRAAQSVMQEFVAERPNELDWLQDACEAGGVLVTIPDVDRAALVDAMAPVVDAVAAGPDAALLDLVRARVGAPTPGSLTCPSAVVSTSAPPETSPTPRVPDQRSAIVPTPGALPNGIYRFTHTLDVLELADPDGEWTASDEMIGEFVLDDGVSEIRFFNLDGTPMAGEPPDTGGVYQVDGNVVIFATPPERSLPGTNGIHLLRWSLDGVTLTFEQIDGKPLDADFGVPWIRVADAP